MSLTWTFSYGNNIGNVERYNGVWLFRYPCLTSNSSCSNYEVTIKPGFYLFELWGAQGGDVTYNLKLIAGALGGYTFAVLPFDIETNLQLFVGGMGGHGDDFSGGFNGGGQGSGRDDYYNYDNKGAGGGGATDVRMKSGSSTTKILVAGGGGGSNSWQIPKYNQEVATGVGGGLEGGKGTVCLGAGQSQKTDPTCTAGSLGQGASGANQGSGGGGGYYGGSGGKDQGQSGGGGSGYIDKKVEIINGIIPTTLSGKKSFPNPSLSVPGNET